MSGAAITPSRNKPSYSRRKEHAFQQIYRVFEAFVLTPFTTWFTYGGNPWSAPVKPCCLFLLHSLAPQSCLASESREDGEVPEGRLELPRGFAPTRFWVWHGCHFIIPASFEQIYLIKNCIHIMNLKSRNKKIIIWVLIILTNFL